MIRSFKRINAKDYDLSKVQDNVDDALSPILSSEVLNGIILSDLEVSSTEQIFNHRLNRQPLGWFVIDRTDDIRVWRTSWNTKTITLKANNSGAVSLWIF